MSTRVNRFTCCALLLTSLSFLSKAQGDVSLPLKINSYIAPYVATKNFSGNFTGRGYWSTIGFEQDANGNITTMILDGQKGKRLD